MRNNYLYTEKAIVNVDNEFSAKGFSFVIPEDNEQYRVVSKYDEDDNYENESLMTYVNVVLGRDMKLYFYDQNWEAIDKVAFKK